MATANPPDTPSADLSVFDAMREQIIEEFDRIIKEVKSRRDQLLSEVEEKRREFVLKNSAMIENVRELEEMKSQLKKTSVKQNLAMKKKQESLTDINSEIAKLRRDMYGSTQLKYSCSLDHLIQQVKQFGEIIDEASTRTLTNSKYCRKLTAVQAVKVINKFAACRFSSIRLHVDSYKELLYVTHSGRETVMVYNANDLTFLKQFGPTNYSPICVTANKEFIYILTTMNCLYKYKSSDFSFVESMESSFFQIFTEYIGITVSEDNQVIIMDSYGSIKLYDRALKYKEKIKLNLKKFRENNHAYCLSLLMRDNIIYILLTNRIILFVPFGDWNNISCYFKKEQGKIPNVENPSAFCIDQSGNLIIADRTNNSIEFLSPEGDLIHTIEEYTMRSDSIRVFFNIASYRDSIIVACRDDENGAHIKIY